jgi:tetratricopeptide (TPR) repeat protein
MLPLDDGGDGDLGRNLTRRVVDVLEPFPLLRVAPASETEEWLAQRGGIVGTAMPPGATRYADGTVTRRGDSLLILITVREAGARPVEKLAASGDTADLWRLAHDVADSLVRRLAPRDAQEFENIRHRPIDLAATNLYVGGKDAFRRGAWEAADRQFSAALERDPQFVQAAWGLMIARRYQRTPFGEVLVTLLRHADALPPFQRGLLEAMNEPDLHARVRRYTALVQSSRGSGEALLHYTNELFHRGALVGRPLAATLDTMSLLADSVRDLAHASTYDLTIWGNVRLGREAEAWQQFRRRAALVPPDDPYGRFHRYALWARFTPAKAWLMHQLVFRSPSTDMRADLARFHRLSLTLDLPQTQVDVGRVLQHRDAPSAIRRDGTIGEALGLVALGRPRAALARLDSAAQSSATEELALQQLEWPVVLAALGLPIDPSSVARGRHGLAGGTFHGAYLARARFALGLDALARGDSGAAQRLADTLDAANDAVAARLGALLGARLAGLRGAHVEALDRSGPVFLLDSVSYRIGPFARSATYLGRGDWQRALGQWQRADGEWSWYENSDLMGWPTAEPQPGEVDAMLAGYARLRRAELALEHDTGKAMCASLARVAALWRRSEPEWSPLVGRVATAKERIGCR